MPKTKPDIRFTALLFLLMMNAVIAFGQAENYPLPDKVARDFKDLLNRPMVDPKPRFGNVSMDSIQVDTGSIYTEANERMPVLIYKPVIAGQTRFPVAIFLHGTGGTKDQGDIRAIFIKLAKLSIMGVAIDARYHGQRIPGGAHGSKEYTEAAYQAFKTNNQTHHAYPFLYDTSYDLWRLVDYLVTRPDVKADRIGMGGISMGGMETWMAASVDVRIHAAVLGIAVQSFKWSLENNKWQGRAGTIGDAHKKAAHDLGDSTVNQANVKAVWDKILPGITGEFDCPSMIRLLAPRPLLVLSNEKDQNCPLPGALIAFDSAKATYATYNAADKLNMDVEPNEPHRSTPHHIQMTLDWFAKWL